MPPLLKPILEYMHANKEDGVNIFTNGAGKLLVAKLLGLLPIGPHVRIATTNNPRYDWCGIDLPHLCGVVDMAVVDHKKLQMIGEIK